MILDLAFGERRLSLPEISGHFENAAMPMGYHSLICDMANSLSGGQQQRAILARALYREPRLLFLDEATSLLDVLKERLVNDAVKELKLTRMIVAHRPETIASTDRVLVMEAGRMIQQFYPQGQHTVSSAQAKNRINLNGIDLRSRSNAT